MGETDKATQDALLEKGQTSEGQKESTSILPGTYTREQMQKLVSDALAEQGRKHKDALEPIIKERDTFKSQADTLEEKDAEIGRFEQLIDDLSSDDPQRFDAIEELKAAREERKQLLADRKAFETEQKAYGETVKVAQNTLREITIWEFAAEYEGGDPIKLKELCDTFEAKSDERIRQVADSLWGKKTTGEPSESLPMKTYSGITKGGSDGLGGLPAKERIKEADRRLRK